jgi:hypothetical protein
VTALAPGAERSIAARWISILGHPFVMITLLIVSVSQRVNPGVGAVQSALLVAAVTILPVAILMWRQVRGGRWSNADASEVGERAVLFGVALAALGLLLLWLSVNDPRSFLVRGTLAVTLLLAVSAALTRWIKVSLHLMFASLAATTLVLLGSAAGAVVLAGLPVLAWSRLALQRHRLSELLAGLALGLTAGIGLVKL